MGRRRWRDDFNDGLESSGREGEPLLHDEVEEVAGVLGSDIARGYADVESCYNLLDCIRVASTCIRIYRIWS